VKTGRAVRREKRPGDLSPKVRTFVLHGLLCQKGLRLTRGRDGWSGKDVAWPIPAREFRGWLAREEERGRIVRLSLRATHHLVFAASSPLLFGQAVSDLSDLAAGACDKFAFGRQKT